MKIVEPGFYVVNIYVVFDSSFAVPFSLHLNDEPIYRFIKGVKGDSKVKNLDSLGHKSFLDLDGNPKITRTSYSKSQKSKGNSRTSQNIMDGNDELQIGEDYDLVGNKISSKQSTKRSK